jgi:iron complex outermembrane recepter protein
VKKESGAREIAPQTIALWGDFMGIRRVPPRSGCVRLCLCTLLALGATRQISLAQEGQKPQQDASATAGKSGDLEKLLDMPLEQLSQTPVTSATPSAGPLMDTPVTSVTKEASTVGKSAAAIFVITNEMIRRSGATCIPEALRMAPGLDVAQFNSNTWAISSRGFDGINAKKLLVLIDGRSVYTPVSSGVYWDVQDVVLEDVERIEVIRGPGGTLWGANAVNGVINIITKKAGDTQGTYINAGGGTVERSFETMRYGGKLGDDAYYRVYGKYFDRSPYYDPTQPANDGWNQGRLGFRTDWNLSADKSDTLTMQGDHYVGASGLNASRVQTVQPYFTPTEGSVRNTGDNVLARYRHLTDENTDWSVQSYFDNYIRDNTVLNSERVRTFDLEFQYRFLLAENHQITCGAGYRYVDTFCPSEDSFTASIQPPKNDLYTVNQFIQDEIALVPDHLAFILGCKLEQNTYTHFEYEPTARLRWSPDDKHTLWGAVSRAVRTPAVTEEHIFATTAPRAGSDVFGRILGNDELVAETLMAYEIGYREQTTERFSWDLATFYNVYDNLIGSVADPPPVPESDPPPEHMILRIPFANSGSANSYGAELATNWSVTENWRLASNYTFLRMITQGVPGQANDPGKNPRHQVSLRSSWDLSKNVDFDLTARYVDCLTSLNVPSYITMDLRMAWRPRKDLELALVGQNLLQPHHYEFGSSTETQYNECTEVPRGVYGTLAWRH